MSRRNDTGMTQVQRHNSTFGAASAQRHVRDVGASRAQRHTSPYLYAFLAIRPARAPGLGPEAW
jgi:hypothetical protein